MPHFQGLQLEQFLLAVLGLKVEHTLLGGDTSKWSTKLMIAYINALFGN